MLLRLKLFENSLGGLPGGEGSETVLAGLVFVKVSRNLDGLDICLLDEFCEFFKKFGVAHVGGELSAENCLGQYLGSVPQFVLRVIRKCSDFDNRQGGVVGPSEEAHYLEHFFVVFCVL